MTSYDALRTTIINGKTYIYNIKAVIQTKDNKIAEIPGFNVKYSITGWIPDVINKGDTVTQDKTVYRVNTAEPVSYEGQFQGYVCELKIE